MQEHKQYLGDNLVAYIIINIISLAGPDNSGGDLFGQWDSFIKASVPPAAFNQTTASCSIGTPHATNQIGRSATNEQNTTSSTNGSQMRPGMYNFHI